MIYHITDKATWLKASGSKSFKAESLDTEGFIHCSPVDKLLEVANSFYKEHTDLLILSIDESKVKSKIIREDLYGHGFEFPHIYGELNLDAVIKISDFKRGENGSYVLPDKI